MEYVFNKILLGNKKEWTTDACNNMNKSQKGYVKQKKVDTKEYILALADVVQWLSASLYDSKGCQFNSQSGHMPELQATPPVGGM